jgi:hypothetical protein
MIQSVRSSHTLSKAILSRCSSATTGKPFVRAPTSTPMAVMFGPRALAFNIMGENGLTDAG